MSNSNNTEIILYQTEDNKTKIQVKLENETVWLSLNQLAVLFQRDKSVISRHIKNIFEEEELNKISVVANFATTTTNYKTCQVEYLNLYVIKSIRYIVFLTWFSVSYLANILFLSQRHV